MISTYIIIRSVSNDWSCVLIPIYIYVDYFRMEWDGYSNGMEWIYIYIYIGLKLIWTCRNNNHSQIRILYNIKLIISRKSMSFVLRYTLRLLMDLSTFGQCPLTSLDHDSFLSSNNRYGNKLRLQFIVYSFVFSLHFAIHIDVDF